MPLLTRLQVRALPRLAARVATLGEGYSRVDLDATLDWIRSDAPIIVHLRLVLEHTLWGGQSHAARVHWPNAESTGASTTPHCQHSASPHCENRFRGHGAQQLQRAWHTIVGRDSTNANPENCTANG